MNPILRAHGYDAGPTQRPALAGALSAAIAEVPTLAVMIATGAFEQLARSVGLGTAAGLLVHIALVLVAGLVYGRVFQRAANDRSGGWMFGLALAFSAGWPVR